MAASAGGKKGCAVPSLRDCANCAAPEGSIAGILTHMSCSKCKITYYCSPKCQREHWNTGGHKQHCVAKEDRSAAVAAAAGAAAETTPDQGDDDAKECSICLEALPDNSPSDIATMPCGHEFHQACMDSMRMHGHEECPLCRQPLPPGAEKCFLEGMEAQLRGRHAQARALFEQALATDPRHTAALNNLGVHYLKSENDAKKAEELFRRVLDIDRAHLYALTSLSDLCFESGSRLEESEALCLRALAVSGEDPHALELMGKLQRDRHGNLRLALDHFRRALRAAPRDLDHHWNVASLLLCHLAMERPCSEEEYAEAEAALRCCVNSTDFDVASMRGDASSPHRGEAALLLGALRCMRGARDGGVNMAKRGASVLLRGQNHVGMFNIFNWVVALHAPVMGGASGDPASWHDVIDPQLLVLVETLLRRAMSLSADVDYKSSLLMVLAAQKKWVERERLKRSFSLRTEEDELVSKIVDDAMRVGRNGDTKGAESLLRKALKLNPFHSEACGYLARSLVVKYPSGPLQNQKQKQRAALKEAEELLRRAIATGDEIAEWFFTLGSTLNTLAMDDDSPEAEPLFLGRVKDADVNYRRALELNPNMVKSYMFKGRNLAMLRRDWVNAAVCFAAVLQLEPGQSTAQGYLEKCRRSMTPEQRSRYEQISLEARRIGVSEYEITLAEAAGGGAGGASAPISIGTNVQLRGLQAKPELNGQRGVVMGFDASSERCSVQLEDGSGPYNIKRGNLEVAAAGAEAARDAGDKEEETDKKKKKKKKNGKNKKK